MSLYDISEPMQKAIQNVLPTAAISRAEKRATDRYAKKYCKKFEKICKNDKRLNVFKTMVALMRSGKTHLAITHNIPYILKNTDCRVVVLTAPLTGIIKQNALELKLAASEIPNVVYCTRPSEVEETLKRGKKAVIYMTNKSAWTGDKAKEVFKSIIDNKIMIATFMDEAWTWTISDEEVVSEISGNSSGDDYQATWYKIMREIAKYSCYTYGLSATETDQLNGKVPATDQSMKYEIVISMLNPKELSYRLAWMGDVTWFYDGASLDGDVLTPEEALQKMVQTRATIESSSKQFYSMNGDYEGLSKRTAMIQCNDKRGYYNISKVSELLINTEKDFDNNTFGFSVLSSDGSYLFNKNGDKQTCSEEDIYKHLDDENHPLRFCLIVNMAKMGVTVRTWKEIFLFPHTETKNKNGSVVYVKNQSMGRGLTPNCGRSSKTFWEFGADISMTPTIPIPLNTVNFYMWLSKTNQDAVTVFKRDFCPSYEDFKQLVKELACPMCGAEPEHQKKEVLPDTVRDNLSATLDIL